MTCENSNFSNLPASNTRASANRWTFVNTSCVCVERFEPEPDTGVSWGHPSISRGGHTSSAFSEMYDLAIEVARSVKAFNGCATQ